MIPNLCFSRFQIADSSQQIVEPLDDFETCALDYIRSPGVRLRRSCRCRGAVASRTPVARRQFRVELESCRPRWISAQRSSREASERHASTFIPLSRMESEWAGPDGRVDCFQPIPGTGIPFVAQMPRVAACLRASVCRQRKAWRSASSCIESPGRGTR